MDTAIDSLHGVVPRVKVVGKLTVHAIDSVPIPILFVLFVICVALFQWPLSSPAPVLPTTRSEKERPRLVALPATRDGQFTYLDTATRQLVVSEQPLLPPSPSLKPKDRCSRLRQALRGYRPPLGCVPEDIEDGAAPRVA